MSNVQCYTPYNCHWSLLELFCKTRDRLHLVQEKKMIFYSFIISLFNCLSTKIIDISLPRDRRWDLQWQSNMLLLVECCQFEADTPGLWPQFWAAQQLRSAMWTYRIVLFIFIINTTHMYIVRHIFTVQCIPCSTYYYYLIVYFKLCTVLTHIFWPTPNLKTNISIKANIFVNSLILAKCLW